MNMIEIFGPVRSRRFGMSLGINNLPLKACSYACVYCQLGRTHPLTISTKMFYHTDEILKAVRQRLDELEHPPDYLTFVANGEPTLDSSLGDHINELHTFGLPIAVISNASLLWREEVRSALMAADIVSVKVDAVDKQIWRRVNRPHGKLYLAKILSGSLAFASEYTGRLLTETMLVAGLNDSHNHMLSLAEFISTMQPEIAYLGLPLRAPAEEWVQAPNQEKLEEILNIFSGIFPRSVLMADIPETGLEDSSEPIKALLRTLKVHPMEKEEIMGYLKECNLPKNTMDCLVDQEQVRMTLHRGKTFYSATYKAK